MSLAVTIIFWRCYQQHRTFWLVQIDGERSELRMPKLYRVVFHKQFDELEFTNHWIYLLSFRIMTLTWFLDQFIILKKNFTPPSKFILRSHSLFPCTGYFVDIESFESWSSWLLLQHNFSMFIYIRVCITSSLNFIDKRLFVVKIH